MSLSSPQPSGPRDMGNTHPEVDIQRIADLIKRFSGMSLRLESTHLIYYHGESVFLNGHAISVEETMQVLRELQLRGQMAFQGGPLS